MLRVGMQFVTLCVTDLSRAAVSRSTQSVQNCATTRSVGAMIIIDTTNDTTNKNAPSRSRF
ncbi:hypothetical protein BVY12_17420 [Pseudomonas amygdali pv. morsprunorum]|nr:hypothetical protein BVY12_17420 [Pseudomonas amygdali pv. morsprunorum]